MRHKHGQNQDSSNLSCEICPTDEVISSSDAMSLPSSSEKVFSQSSHDSIVPEEEERGNTPVPEPVTGKGKGKGTISEWKPFKPVKNAQGIADALKQIPGHWSLTPVQDKRPMRKDWQTEESVPHQDIANLILHGEPRTGKNGKRYTHYWSGYGLRTGDQSGGIIAIDVDGASAQPLLDALANGDLPTTVSWTSGKPGRYQIAYQVPDEIRPLISGFNRKSFTEVGDLKTACDQEGKPIELLEIRYNGVQSVLPPSRHPETGSYQWINSLDTTEVAIAPKWLCDLLVKLAEGERTKKDQDKERAANWAETQKQAKYQGGVVTDLVDVLNYEILPKLSIEQIFCYPNHNFREYGKTLKGCPPWRSSVSGTSFHVWTDENGVVAWQDKSSGEGGNAVQYRWKLKGGIGVPRGRDFVQIVKELAAEAGVQMPALLPRTSGNSAKDGSTTPDGLKIKNNILQKAFDDLFSDQPWICADDRLFCWQETYYEHVIDDILIHRIAEYCNSYPVVDKNGDIVFPYANPGKVEEILRWVKARLKIDPRLLNPSGINCSNGVLEVKWETGKPVRHLEEHDPSRHYYTYAPLIEYDPTADPTDCNRLLQCLDQSQQQILLRNLGAAIDLPEVRKRRGREVKILLLCGLGSNGKDALRQVVSTIYGHQGMTSVSLADFAHYDDGRKFALAPLLYSRVNWASENPQTARLDKIQSLKLFATGNMLHSERKGRDHVEFIPKAVGLFNLNEVPALLGVLQAIQDRIAPLEFRKTFKINPDPNNPNELQADPRFAYDEEFVRTKVTPAFLNLMLDALEDLIAEGVDYSSTEDSFKAMQKENNHLWQFCEDVGLGYSPDQSMTAAQLWEKLEVWYLDNGTLSIDDNGRRVWAEQVRPSDKNVKAINQVIQRIKQLFSKATIATTRHATGKKPISVLKGVGIITTNSEPFSISEFSTPISNFPTPVAPQSPPQQILINQDLHPNHPNFSNGGGKK